MLCCPVAHSIVRGPELDRVIVAASGKNNASRVHLDKTLLIQHIQLQVQQTTPTIKLRRQSLAALCMHANVSMAIRVHGQQSASEAMQLLQKPAEGEDTFSKPLKRSSCSYEDGCERFRVRERRFQQQYANLYFMRLSRMRQMVKATALDKWGKSLDSLITMRAFNIVGGWRQKPAIKFFLDSGV